MLDEKGNKTGVGEDAIKIGYNQDLLAYEDPNAGEKSITYGGITILDTNSDVAKNYLLKDTKGNIVYDATEYYAEGERGSKSVGATGEIFKLHIDNNAFQIYQNGTLANTSKVYDGTSAYGEATNLSTTDILEGDRDKISFTPTSDGVFKDANGIETANATDNNGAKYIAYDVTIAGDAKNNYTFGESVHGAVALPDTAEVSGEGRIEKRKIYLALKQSENIDKDYDTKADVLDSKFLKENVDYVTVPGYDYNKLVDGDTYTVAAAYQSTNGEGAANVRRQDVKDANTPVVENGKKVFYKIDIVGGNAGNYDLRTDTLEGTGKIKPLSVRAKVDDVTKVYDGTTDVTDNLTGKAYLVDKDNQKITYEGVSVKTLC